MAFYSKFIWADLSTYNIEEALGFYHTTFGWAYHESNIHNESPYFMAHQSNRNIAGIYELPEEFRKQNFPSFWMPYIHVQDVQSIVEKARSYREATIEVPPTLMADGSKIALIRDPLGAGFTIYEGDAQTSFRAPVHGELIWFELHVSLVIKVQPFYENLLDWEIDYNSESAQALISLQNGVPIANIYELPKAFRCGYEYWIPTFGVMQYESYCNAVDQAGGTVDKGFGDGRKAIVDSQGASFMVANKDYIKKTVRNYTF